MSQWVFLNYPNHLRILRTDSFPLLQISIVCIQSGMMEKKKYTSAAMVDSSNCNGNLWMESSLNRRVSESNNSDITFSFISQVQSTRKDYERTNGRACSCQVLLKLCIPATPFSARHTLREVLVFKLRRPEIPSSYRWRLRIINLPQFTQVENFSFF